jgi:hypothetical protein
MQRQVRVVLHPAGHCCPAKAQIWSESGDLEQTGSGYLVLLFTCLLTIPLTR